MALEKGGFGRRKSVAAMPRRGARLVSDLASGIGTLRWFRSLAILVFLIALALAFWPDFSELNAAPSTQLTRSERDEYRSQMITPLALGADSGRRMGPSRLVVALAAAPERPVVEMTTTLNGGDTLVAMLRRVGVGDSDADRVAALIGQTMPESAIADGTAFDLRLGRRPSPEMPRPLERVNFRARFDLELGVERDGGPLRLVQRPIRVDDTPLRIRGKVGAGLYRAARAAGAPARSVQQYLTALDEAVDLDRAVGADDEFDMIVQYRRAATGEVEVGDLLYAGLSGSGKAKAQLLRWGREGRFFDANGTGEMRSGLIAPVNGAMSSRYGMRRHPILKYKRMHKGVDFRGRTGTPIYAVTDGRVVRAGRNGGHGNYVRIDHGGGLASGYSHMSRIAVSSSASVRRGQVIGYVGSTGLSTGPHLHYELYRNGGNIDPLSVKFVTRALLSGAELRQFRARLAELKQVQPGAALRPLVPDAARRAEPVREIDRLSNGPE